MTRKLYLAAGILSWLLALPATALQLQLLPVPATVGLGSSVDLILQVSGLDAAQQVVSSYDVLLSFDPAVVQATAVTFGSDLGGPANSLTASDLATAGQVELSEVTFLTDAELFALQGDSVVLATLRFFGLALGTSPVQIVASLLTGAEDPLAPGFPIVLDPALADTRIEVQQAPEPGPLLLLLVALGAAALSYSRRVTPLPPSA